MKTTIVVKARVCLVDEDSFDNQLLGDDIEPKRFVAWRNLCIPIGMTTKITEYDRNKSILHTISGDILVKETFESLEPRWSKLSDDYEKLRAESKDEYEDDSTSYKVEDADESEDEE